MAKFPSTLLPQSNEPQEIQKAILDLLDKINQVSTASVAVPPGVIHEYAGATAPAGYLLCDGASHRRVDYPALFAAIGTTWGTADSASFNVPNLKGVSPTGVGAQDIGGRTKTGPALGEVREDVFQGHYHEAPASANSAIFDGGYIQPGAGSVNNLAADGIRSPITDTVNGTPRTGAYTHGPEVGVNFIIKT